VAGRVAVLGEQALVAGFTLTGALVVPAATAAETRTAWRDLPADVVLVVLTPAAAAALEGVLAAPQVGRLTVVAPG
jgi:vacuolar-type H+-ATPase subunit F/Vma7